MEYKKDNHKIQQEAGELKLGKKQTVLPYYRPAINRSCRESNTKIVMTL
jgi:hypothetical protein